MNGNDHNEMHELLCAYVLGEASAEDAQRVERALNDSPELREEKTRLEQTIGLVQGAFTGNDKLSDERLTNILSAAGSEPAPVIQALDGHREHIDRHHPQHAPHRLCLGRASA